MGHPGVKESGPYWRKPETTPPGPPPPGPAPSVPFLIASASGVAAGAPAPTKAVTFVEPLLRSQTFPDPSTATLCGEVRLSLTYPVLGVTAAPAFVNSLRPPCSGWPLSVRTLLSVFVTQAFPAPSIETADGLNKPPTPSMFVAAPAPVMRVKLRPTIHAFPPLSFATLPESPQLPQLNGELTSGAPALVNTDTSEFTSNVPSHTCSLGSIDMLLACETPVAT